MLFVFVFCTVVTLNFLSYSIAFAQGELTVEQYEEDFDFLWETFRTDYAYFDEKQTDWERVRTIYQAESPDGCHDVGICRADGEGPGGAVRTTTSI